MNFLMCCFDDKGKEEMIEKLLANNFTVVFNTTPRDKGCCRIFTSSEELANTFVKNNQRINRSEKNSIKGAFALEARNDITEDILAHNYGKIVFYPPPLP